MPDWSTQALRAFTSTEEVHLATRRANGTLRSPRIIWVVTSGRRVFIRSTNGPGAAWYRAATATGAGQLTARGVAHDVTFTHVQDEADLAAVDAGYRAKYGRYASIVDHLEEPGPRAATLEVHPHLSTQPGHPVRPAWPRADHRHGPAHPPSKETPP